MICVHVLAHGGGQLRLTTPSLPTAVGSILHKVTLLSGYLSHPEASESAIVTFPVRRASHILPSQHLHRWDAAELLGASTHEGKAGRAPGQAQHGQGYFQEAPWWPALATAQPATGWALALLSPRVNLVASAPAFSTALALLGGHCMCPGPVTATTPTAQG